MKKIQTSFAFGIAFVETIIAATCPTLTAPYGTPVVADGWQATLIAQNLTAPRSIILDSKGGLLVVESGAGVVHLTFDDGGGGCMSVSSKTQLITSPDLNHGIALSADGNTLYASSSESVFAWTYDPSGPSVGKTNQTIVTGMSNDDHTTRTLLISAKQPDTLVVSRGSESNIDIEAENLATGHSQIKAYAINNITSDSKPYDFTTEGRLLGWGLRNSVGVAEEPLTGGIYSVENSADDVERNGVDIHQNNPGEEMNFHGFLNASTEDQGGNYGYPYCFALWNTSIPDLANLTVGSQFTLDQNATINDDFCASERVPPRITFQAHMAPLDIIFLPNGTEAFVSFHGSWDRSDPVGYKVSTLQFENGAPVAAADSNTAITDIFYNADNSKCPDGCFRPVGLELDSQDRMFVSSDTTGEIYILVKTKADATTPSTTSAGLNSPSSTSSPSPTNTKKSEGRIGYTASASALLLAVVGAFALL